jgi:hypothetical protein
VVDEDDPRAAPTGLRAAAGLVALEALALLVLAVVLVVDTADGHALHAARGLLSALFALIGAGVFALGARGLIRMSSAARTPVVVLELLALPVSWTIVFQANKAALGAPILIVALVVLYLLFTPPVRAVLDRDITR